MKKLLFLFFLLIPSLCWGAGTITISGAGTTTVSRVIASGSVTNANIRKSLVNGTAFADFSAANVLTNYIGYRLTIIDSNGDKAIGYIKAAGSGETLATTGGPLNDGELFSDPTFDTSAAWSIAYAGEWDIDVSNEGKATAISTGTNSGIYYNPTTISGALYKLVTVCDSLSGGNYGAYIVGNYYSNLYVNTVGTVAWYATAYGGDNSGIESTGLSATFTSISLKQVLTPSATGVTITSTKDGATYNWASITAGFNYNDASNYTYTIEDESTVTLAP